MRDEPWVDPVTGTKLANIGPWLYEQLSEKGRALYRWDVPSQRYVLKGTNE